MEYGSYVIHLKEKWVCWSFAISIAYDLFGFPCVTKERGDDVTSTKADEYMNFHCMLICTNFPMIRGMKPE
jgi:hypothetical protein